MKKLINKIKLLLFGTDFQLLSSKTDNILGVFNKTIQDLKDVHNETETLVKNKQELIDRISFEIHNLQDLQGQHNKIITNIENLLK